MRSRLSIGALCGVLVCLGAGSAQAAPVVAAPRMVAAAAWAAGHPVTVACDADANPSPAPSPGYVATAWTFIGGDLIHVYPSFCRYSTAEPGTEQFAQVIDVFLHEAARAKGVSGDSCAELFADLAVYDVLRRFWGVPFFSPLSEQVGAQVLAVTRTLPDVFEPGACWASGVMR